MFKNKNGQIRSGWKILSAYAVFYCCTFFVLYLCNIFVLHYLNFQKNLGFYFTENEYSEFYILLDKLYIIIQNIVMIIIPVFFWKVLSKRKLEDMGLKNVFKCRKHLFIGLIMGIVSMTLVFLIIILTGSGYVVDLNPNFTMETLYYFIVFVFVGIGEETMTRGYFMSVLRQTKNMFLIFFISAVIFSLMHIFNSDFSLIPFINIVLVGMLFSYMYVKTGNILMPIGYHITWNYFQGSIYGLKVSGLDIDGVINTKYLSYDILNGGGFGPEGGLIVTFVIIISFIFVYFNTKKEKFSFLDMDS